MCGIVTMKTSYGEAVAFSNSIDLDQQAGPVEDDPDIRLRVMANLPLHVWDKEAGQRRVLAARWGFPHRSEWRRPDPIHARSETIDEKPTFKNAFLDDQRGVLLVSTFNEAPDIEGPTIQHTITPDSGKSGIAMLWRKFDVGAAAPLFACVMVTVPANLLISGLPTDRMPAILDPADWAKWTGEEPASVDELKGMLKTVEGIRWIMTREEKKATTKRGKPTVTNPGRLL
ncbi:MAG: SOS response-associated peptidase family protein [Pseudomonadota bacterium]